MFIQVKSIKPILKRYAVLLHYQTSNIRWLNLLMIMLVCWCMTHQISHFVELSFGVLRAVVDCHIGTVRTCLGPGILRGPVRAGPLVGSVLWAIQGHWTRYRSMDHIRFLIGLLHVVTMFLSWTVSEMYRDDGRKSPIFPSLSVLVVTIGVLLM